MVSFVCNACQDTIKKPKLDQHKSRCRNASFTCIDCSTDFIGTEYRSHNSCISEAEKYQKSLYQPKKKHQQQEQKSAPPSPPKSPKSDTACDSKVKETSTDVDVVQLAASILKKEKKKSMTLGDFMKVMKKKTKKVKKVMTVALDDSGNVVLTKSV